MELSPGMYTGEPDLAPDSYHVQYNASFRLGLTTLTERTSPTQTSFMTESIKDRCCSICDQSHGLREGRTKSAPRQQQYLSACQCLIVVARSLVEDPAALSGRLSVATSY